MSANNDVLGLLNKRLTVEVAVSEEFRVEQPTLLVRALWREYMQRTNSPKTFRTNLESDFKLLLSSLIKKHMSIEPTFSYDNYWNALKERVSVEGFCPDESGLKNIYSYRTFEDLIEKLCANKYGYYTNFKRAWETIRPYEIATPPKLITSIREINLEFMKLIKMHPDALDSVSWEAFEKLIAEIFASKGFNVDLTGRIRNSSSDIIALRTDEFGVETKYLIECKRYRKDRRIGLDIVNKVVGAARRAQVDHAFLVTSSSFTSDVKKLEANLKDLRLHLRDGDEIREWLSNYKPRKDGGIWLASNWEANDFAE